MKSAKQLTQQPVWVKEGYRYTYYPYDPASKHVDFAHDAGLLLPIEKLEIKDVITAMPAGKGRAEAGDGGVSERREELTPCRLGSRRMSSTRFIPTKCFSWKIRMTCTSTGPPDVWQAVEQHQVKPGMNEMQADFAIGMGVPDAGEQFGKDGALSERGQAAGDRVSRRQGGRD